MSRPALTSTFAPAALLVLLSPQMATAAAEISDTSAYLRLTWGLLIVLGIILIFYALAKKRFSLLSSSEKNLIKVLEIKHLMPKKSICLIEVRGREYLLGIGADNVSLIAGLPQNSDSTFASILEKSSEAAEK